MTDETKHLISSLSADRDAWKRRAEAAVKDLRSIIRYGDDGCKLCAHYVPCGEEVCPHYTSGVGANGPDGEEYPDFKWTCEDFSWGTCPAMENTPCNGCDFGNHWQWRGPVDGDGHKEA